MAKTYRVKTKAEFRKEFGNEWREKAFWQGDEEALGQVISKDDYDAICSFGSKKYSDMMSAHYVEFTINGKEYSADLAPVDLVEVKFGKPSMLTHIVGAC